MTLSLSNKNVPSAIAMTLTMITMIAPADAQITTCKSTSPQCCWMKRIYQLLKKTTSVSAASATACCYYLGSKTQTSGIPGVTCTSTGLITEIRWPLEIDLDGEFPSEIGNLVNLEYLRINKNKNFNGTLPSTLANLVNLKTLWLDRNDLNGQIPSIFQNLKKIEKILLQYNHFTGTVPQQLGANGGLTKLTQLTLLQNKDLSGPFTPSSFTKLRIEETGIIVCGVAAASTIPAILTPLNTYSEECLATGKRASLAKRTPVYSLTTATGYIYTCDTDPNLNPFANCLNSMSSMCNPQGKGFSKDTCKTGVNEMFGQMNIYWKNVRKFCGQWKWTDQFIGNKDSTACSNANKDLFTNGEYKVFNAETNKYENIKVTEEVTKSMTQLWSIVAIKD